MPLLGIMRPENYAVRLPGRVTRLADKVLSFEAVRTDDWRVEVDVWHDGRTLLTVRDQHGRTLHQVNVNAAEIAAGAEGK